MRGVLARAWSRFEEVELGPVLLAVALFLTTFIGSLVWGSALVTDVVLAGGVVWAVSRTGSLGQRLDRAWDDADLALGKAEAIEHHLTGMEPPSTGQHAWPTTWDAG